MERYFSKKRIVFLFVIVLLIILAGLYTTYAIDNSIDPLAVESDMTISFELSNFFDKEITIEARKSKIAEMKIINNNSKAVKYAVTYGMINPPTIPDDFIIEQSLNSERATIGLVGANSSVNVAVEMINNTDSPVTIKLNTINGYKNGGDLIVPPNEVIVPKKTYEGMPIYDMIDELALPDDRASVYVSKNNGIDFLEISSETNGKGIYTLAETKNYNLPVHYYRGAVENNNVYFGNFCWKIVRTTETGGTKLLYNGIRQENGSCDNVGSNVFISGSYKYNNSTGKIEYAGYSYQTAVLTQNGKYAIDFPAGTVFGKSVSYDSVNNIYTLNDTTTITYDSSSSTGFQDFSNEISDYHYSCLTTSTTCSDAKFMYMGRQSNTTIYYISLNKNESIAELLEKTYITEATNATNSTMHTNVDNWFRDNMTAYTSYLEDAVWCNDRSVGSIGGWSDTGEIYEDDVQNVSMKLQFGSFTRVLTGKPSALCPNKVDRFTTSSLNGNGNLTYPVGLITGDEAVLAGHVWWVSNTSTYIHNRGTNRDTFWWTMSPSYLAAGGVYAILGYDMLDGLAVNYGSLKIGLRPMISLKYGIIIDGGVGTVDDPFIVSDV